MKVTYKQCELCVTIENIEFKDIKLKFKQPLKLLLKQEDGLYIAEDKKFNLYVYGKGYKIIIKEVNEQLVMMWKSYCECDINTLAQEAKDLRFTLLNNLKKIN